MGIFKKKMKKLNYNFKNKVVLITGSSEGLGYEAAKHFLISGANLIICSRNFKKIKKAHKNLESIKKKKQKIFSISADVSKSKDVKRLLKVSLKKFKKIDILINNAGVLGPKGHIEKINWKNWVKTIEINLLGSVLLCKSLIPHFKKKNKGKIIQLSGGGATGPFPMFGSYAVSKAGIVRFIENLSEENKKFNININAVSPGILNTSMLDEILRTKKSIIGYKNYKKYLLAKKKRNNQMKEACDLILFLGSNYSNGISGKLISAKWDNWRNWMKRKNKIKSSDVYTIRRIVGKDRGMKWGDK